MKHNLKNLLFIDIETVGMSADFHSISPRFKELWTHKSNTLDKEKDVAALFAEKSGIYAEFGKIIVIGLGFLYFNESKEICLKTKSLHGHDEKHLLLDFKSLLETKFTNGNAILCAHNGKEFDFPYLCRRMMVHGIGLPACLQLSDKKPWEVQHIDTLEMWKFGDKKSYTSLDLLAAVFDIPSSKSEMDGSKIHEYYYHKNALEQISAYCIKDVEVLAHLYLKFNDFPHLLPQNITQ